MRSRANKHIALRRRLRVAQVTFATAALAALTPAAAQMPVTDAANTAQNVEQLARTTAQLREMIAQGESLVQQIELMEAEVAALTTPSHYGAFANSEPYRRLRRLGAAQDVLDALSDGARGPIAELGREVIAAYGLGAGGDVYAPRGAGRAHPLSHAHDRSRQAVAAGAGTTRAVLAGSDRRVDTLEALLREIDATPTAKASADLLARIAVENGLMLNEVLRLLAVNLELQQAALAHELASDQADADFFVATAPTDPFGGPDR